MSLASGILGKCGPLIAAGVRAKDSGSGVTSRGTAQQVHADQKQAGSSLVKQESEIKKKN